MVLYSPGKGVPGLLDWQPDLPCDMIFMQAQKSPKYGNTPGRWRLSSASARVPGGFFAVAVMTNTSFFCFLITC
ncbi:hypothetical protein HMPREF9374_1771 [Desmospora sp. 8437]|nr:hypothetical protein HMPREF9374_1771 [Desmospora sp. 8437]